MNLGERIKKARGKLNQVEFAAKIGISARSLGYYEKDAHVPDAATIKAICTVTGVSSDWLLFGDDLIPDDSDLAEIIKYDEINYKNQIKKLQDENRKLLHEKGELAIQLVEKAIDPERDFVVPVIGLAECSLSGWEQISKKGLHA